MSLLFLAIPVVLVILLIVNIKKNTEEQVDPERLREIDSGTQPKVDFGTLMPLERLLLTGAEIHGPHEAVYYQDTGRPVGLSAKVWYSPHRKAHVMRCRPCQDEYDLDLVGRDHRERESAAHKFLLEHYACPSTPTNNPHLKQGAPGG